jgi:hypothetical protein
MRTHLKRLLLTVLVPLCAICGAQHKPSAIASIALIARLPGSITLTERFSQIEFAIGNGSASIATVPVEVRWNLDPRETQSFQVIASLTTADPSWAPYVEASTDGVNFRPFAGGRQLVLFNVPITLQNRQGHEQRTVELKLDNAAISSLADGYYRASLRLEVRQQ